MILYSIKALSPITVLLGDDSLNKPNIHNQIMINSRGKIYRKFRIIGFKVSEKIGIAIVNPRGIAKAKLNTVIE